MCEFRVRDSQGIWGDVRIEAENPSDAEDRIRDELMREEVEPNGSLLAGFTLELLPCLSYQPKEK